MSDNTDYDPPILAGRIDDDDGVYVDALFQEDSVPPTPDEIPREVVDAQRVSIPSLGFNRLVSSSATYTDDASLVIRLLPADPRRKTVVVTSYPGCFVSDDPNLLTGSRSMAFLLYEGVTLTLADYTGPLYAVPLATGIGLNPWRITCLAVTQ